ncbi:hypothetical protein AAMO2058_001390500 [Amorphochlora amoebiformis]
MSGLGRKFGGDVSELGIECIEFLAQDELITILPKFKMPEINLIAGSIGPFEPQHPVDVPLWLAIQLRKEGKCSIITPDWLDNEYLAIKETSERSDEKNFTDMPYHHHEIATMLFKTAHSDIKEARKVRTVLANINDLRSCKIKKGLKSITEKVHFIKLNNISSMELYAIRKFCILTLNSFKSISQATPTKSLLSQTHSQTQASSQSYSNYTPSQADSQSDY